MSNLWLFRRFLVVICGGSLIGGIIGWLTYGEIDPEV